VRVLVFGLVVVPEQKRSYTRSLDEGQHSMSEQAEDVYRSKEEVAEALRDLKGEKGAWRLPSVGYEVSPPGCGSLVPFITSCLQRSLYLEPPYLFWRVVLHRTADTQLVTAVTISGFLLITFWLQEILYLRAYYRMRNNSMSC
jgi:hypothetical protein